MLLPARLAATRGTAVAVSATAAATGTWNLRSCFIHRQPPSAKLLIVQLGDGTLGVVVRRHLDEGEATRSARVAIPHHRDALDVARLSDLSLGSTALQEDQRTIRSTLNAISGGLSFRTGSIHPYG